MDGFYWHIYDMQDNGTGLASSARNGLPSQGEHERERRKGKKKKQEWSGRHR
jgi:hypothetical protein